MTKFLRKLYKDKTRLDQSGLSLIETAVLLIVLGLLLIPILHLQSIERKYEVVSETTTNIATIQSALRQYAVRNGRYPQPAQRNVSEGSSAFGTEYTGAIGNCSGDDTVPCRVAGARDPDPGNFTNSVLIGDVPFAEIGLPQNFIIDGYGSKFTYAITEGLTLPTNNFSTTETFGTIKVVDRGDTDRQNTESNAHFVIISHGENQRGAWSLSGQLIAPCNDGNNRRENENCNNADSTFTDNLASFKFLISGEDGSSESDYTTEEKPWFSRVENSDFFDDYIGFDTSISGEMWSKSNANNPLVSDVSSRIQGNIRIGRVPTNFTKEQIAKLTRANTQIEVMGNAMADEIRVNALCPYPNKTMSYSFDRTTSASSPFTCINSSTLAKVQTYKDEGKSLMTVMSLLSSQGVPAGELYSVISAYYFDQLAQITDPVTNPNGSDIPRYVFDPAVIGGQVNQNNDDLEGTDATMVGAGIYCGSQPLGGIKAADEICTNAIISGEAAKTLASPCPSGEYLRGIRENGSAICCLPGKPCE